jgi:nitroreductase/dihydropteridine reductase
VEFKDIVTNRHAVRHYEPKPVSEDTVRELLEMIRYSVSAINLQPWKIKLVSDPETKEKLLPVSFNQPQITGCSHLLVLCAYTDYPAIISRLDAAIAATGAPDDMRAFVIGMATDVAGRMTPEQQLQWSKEQVYIALGNALNGAYSLGLGACPMTAFDPAEYARILGLPATVVPTVLVSMGYPAGDAPAAKLRFPIEDILV